jgi:glycosyltransferase involved in cell wall biosynthesis
MKLTIILPVLNEEAGIKQSISAILTKVTVFCPDVQLLIIDDGSTDKTAAILRQVQKKDNRIAVITHPKNAGYGAALRSGIEYAMHDWIFFTDADMQFDCSELEKFLPKIRQFDFIIGYRRKRADALQRRIVSGIYNRLIRMLFGLKVRDVDCAFKLMRKSALKKIDLRSNSFFVSVELMVKAFKLNFRITELGVEHYPRVRGDSTVTGKQMVRSMIDLMKLYRSLL